MFAQKNSLVQLLSRQTKLKYIPEIDGLRFLAILPVISLHFFTTFSRYNGKYQESHLKDYLPYDVINTLGSGVYLFFAISGFILSLPFARHYLFNHKKVSLKYYFIRRVTRLEPPYMITLTLFFIVHLVISNEAFVNVLSHYMASAFYMHNIIYDAWSTINPVAWSLEIEIQFYLLVPLLVQVFRIKNVAIRRGIIIFSIVIFVFLQETIDLRYYNLNLSIVNYAQYFMCGLLVADLSLSRALGKYPTIIYDILATLFIPLMFYVSTNKTWFIIAIFLVFVGVLGGKYVKAMFQIKLLTIIGGMCYTIYLVHYPLYHLLIKITNRLLVGDNILLDISTHYMLHISIIIMGSAIMYVFIEKPFMDYKWPEKAMALIKRYSK